MFVHACHKKFFLLYLFLANRKCSDIHRIIFIFNLFKYIFYNESEKTTPSIHGARKVVVRYTKDRREMMFVQKKMKFGIFKLNLKLSYRLRNLVLLIVQNVDLQNWYELASRAFRPSWTILDREVAAILIMPVQIGLLTI